MQQSVGTGPAAERIINYARARLLNLQRDGQFKRMRVKGKQLRSILGSKMELDADQSGLDRDLLLDSIREPVATGHILNILGPEDVVLEVGANIGYYALIEARICKKIYAAEPHPKNFERLQTNIALNNYTNIEPYNLAFASQDGPIAMQCSDLSNWHSCKDIDDAAPGVINVKGQTIDSFVEGKLAPSFIKMDVEGFEGHVLRGAQKTLRIIKHLFLEIHGDILSSDEIRDVLDRISAAGLTPSLIIQYDRPGLSKIYDTAHLQQIYQGDRGTYELFFERK